MTLQVFISQDILKKSESGFEHPYERVAALQIAKLMWRRYNGASRCYALIANIKQPPADLVILTSTGLGIIDLKDYSSPLGGTELTSWHVVDATGKKLSTLSSGSHANPFQQVKNYRGRIFDGLSGFARREGLPTWMHNREFFISGAVVFSAGRIDTTYLKLAPEATRPWFNLLFTDDVADWAYGLNFGAGKTLTDAQIELIARKYFVTAPWQEIQGHLDTTEPYAYLWVRENNVDTWPLTLDQDEIAIGREPDNAIMLDETKYALVSRRHALVRRTPAGAVLIDTDSKNGTWLNTQRVTNPEGVLLKSGDVIMLGKYEEGAAAAGSCTLVYKSAAQLANLTISDMNN